MRSSRPSGNPVDPTGEFFIEASAYLFYLLFQASRQRDLHYDRKLAALGLNLHRWRILAVIRRIENCSMKDLALFGAVDRTTLTRTVDRLVAEGLVERWAAPRDRRRVNVSRAPKATRSSARRRRSWSTAMRPCWPGRTRSPSAEPGACCAGSSAT
jgi:DNA-binding MarR family transcriptional regulator